MRSKAEGNRLYYWRPPGRARPYCGGSQQISLAGGGGIGLHEAIGKVAPTMADRFIFVTGDTVIGPATINASGRAAVILEKPFTLSDINHAIDQVLKTM